MPALNVVFTDEEMESLRAAAAREKVSLKRFTYEAAMSAAGQRKIADIAAGVAQRSAELNDRLAR